MKKLASTILLLAILRLSLQDCPEEYSREGISVKWRKSPPAFNVESDPLCYREDELVKRNCSDSGKWTPPASDIEPCTRVEKFLDLLSCPPGFHKISENNTDYCYKIAFSSIWNSPCFTSGGASIITDLDKDDISSLIDSLVALNKSRYYWLPAQRRKLFNPVVWTIPGPNWGQQVVSNSYLKFENMFWRNCLALDIVRRMLITGSCSDNYPSLCFYINNAHYPALCPDGYQAFRYKPDNGTCYGIESSKSEEGLTFESFINTKCKEPMNNKTHLNRFIFSKIAEVHQLPNNSWCWFDTSNISEDNLNSSRYLTIINNVGTLGVVDSSSKMSCMACEAEVLYGHTEFMFEFNSKENKIYLTIYFPSGLWKYDLNDKGVQCFSDAKGFVRVVDISDSPNTFVQLLRNGNNQTIEKIVYTINLVTDRSAQYWCEGHTFNFTLVTTDKIVVNPKGNEVHVFALTVNCYNITDNVINMPDLDDVTITINESLKAQKTLLMDILELTNEYIKILLHVHAAVIIIHEDKTQNLTVTYETLKTRAMEVLPTVNCTFVNLASSVYCFPTTTYDPLILDWDLTPVGHISAPQQFCLQSNGLPVRRQCQGSYHRGGQWGPVDGECDDKYVPSETTTFLYNIVKGQTPEHDRENFITEGLSFVLSNVSSIIPADIYYLSMSLKEILNMAQQNESYVDIGDIQNIAWVMDRVTNLDYSYMHLAQTLNSTNVILNSVNGIIEMIAGQNVNVTADVEKKGEKLSLVENAYEIAVKPNFVVQISYPELNNITGIAIYKRSLTGNFIEMDIKPLFANTTLDEVLAIQYLEVATWFPSNLLKSLKENHNDTKGDSISKNLLHIIIDVFQNDVVFQELNSQDHKTNSRIVGVSIPGYLSNLEYPLPIVFKNLKHSKSKKMCGFWDFQPIYTKKSLGLWKTQGCYPAQSNSLTKKYTICECYHLTHFSQLISISANMDIDDDQNASEIKKHTKALNVITLVGCFLSLLGTTGIWITAMVFSNWRRKPGTKVLLQLTTAISLPLIFTVISNLDNSIFIKVDDGYEINEKKEILCIILGVILHYSILASFMWMLITAVLQFVRYVRVLGVSRPSRFMFKFALIGWGLPLIPVIIVLAIDYENYIPYPSVSKPMCYPKGLYFILSVMLPVCVILLVNVILFVLVLHSISRSSNEKTKPVDMNHVAAQLRLSIFLFFLLGLTWIFGIFSSIQNVLWSYLFCLTATLQGFVLFIYFIVCDPVTRHMWMSLVKPSFSTNSSSRNSITSISS